MFTLSQAQEAVNGHDEFVVKHYDGKISFDYILVFEGSFSPTDEEIRNRAYALWERAGGPITDSDQFWLQAEHDVKHFAHIRRNFRGVTFDAQTEEMISLPLHKFFNVNQIPETQYDLIKDQDAVIYEKLDGTMIHFFLFNGKLEASTCRSTQNPYSVAALALAKRTGVDSAIIDTIKNGWTPIFEYVAPTNQIVVQYKEPRLVYLISRQRETGIYHYHDSFPDKSQRYEFKFEEVFNNLDQTEFEGYVCHLSNMIVKAKTPWYIERHRAVDALMRPAYKLYKIVFDGLMDDLIAIATEPYKPALRRIYNEAQQDLLDELKNLNNKFETLSSLFKEQMALIVEENPIEFFEQEIAALKAEGKVLEAIKRVRDFTGLGLMDAKNYVQNRIWPNGFIRRDEQAFELKTLSKLKANFSELAQRNYPNDFALMMSLYLQRDPTEDVKVRLMDGYRIKYKEKLYAQLEENHEE